MLIHIQRCSLLSLAWTFVLAAVCGAKHGQSVQGYLPYWCCLWDHMETKTHRARKQNRTPQISYGRHGQLSSVSNTQPELLLLCSRRSCWSFSPLYLNSSDSVDYRTDGWIIQWQEKSSALSPSSLVDMAREPFISMLLGSEWMWILQGWPCCALKSAIFCPLIWPKYWILFAHPSFYSLYVISFETSMFDNGHHIPKYWWGLCQIPHSG